MDSTQRKRLQRSVSAVIGLELWLIGELDIDEQELTHLFSSLQARMAVIQAIIWPSDDEPLDAEADADSADVDSNERNPYG